LTKKGSNTQACQKPIKVKKKKGGAKHTEIREAKAAANSKINGICFDCKKTGKWTPFKRQEEDKKGRKKRREASKSSKKIQVTGKKPN